MGVMLPADTGRATMPPMATTPDLVAPAYARSRRAAAAGFFTQGFVFISLTTRLPKVQDHWHYSDTTLSLLLLMMVLLAGLGSVVAESACRRVDSLSENASALIGNTIRSVTMTVFRC